MLELATTRDAILDERLLLRQPARGHRIGTDAILLGAAAPCEAGLVIDAGAGVGAAGLMIARRSPGAELRLLDNDPATLRLAEENLALNGLADRGRTILADLLVPKSRRAAGLADGAAALVVTNPPFFAPGSVRPSPDDARARAHVLAQGTLDAWLRATLALLAPSGRLVMIHRPTMVGAILAALANRAGAVALLPVHGRPGEDASRLLVGAIKGSRGPLVWRPPLVLHAQDGRFQPEAEAIHRGSKLIDLFGPATLRTRARRASP